MTDRLRSASTVGYHPSPSPNPSPKMENDLSPRKTMLVLVIVVGCFAVLWPKVFYPMLVGSANQYIKPSPIDKSSGCCDVISETDVNTIKIMSELCGTIIKTGDEDRPLSGREIVQRCRQEVLETCGIDISAVLQEQVRLGQSIKQILDEIRSLNGSLCLKYNYGVAPWRLGVPHRVTVKTSTNAPNIRQERPMHLRSELVHPAFRERGRAIPQPQAASPVRRTPRVVEGRPGPVPGMRPTIGGAGGVVPPPKQGTGSMSIIMPIYTIGIVIFFTYTLMKIIFKKQPQNVGGSLYPPVDPDPHFRKEVFESESSRLSRLNRESISSKLVVNAMSALLDEVDQEIEARRKSSEIASQDLVNGTLSNGDAVKPQDEEQPTVKVLGMEMTASCEGGKKWSRPESPVLPTPTPPPPAEPVPPPQEIFLEGALPPQSQLLVADSATEPEPTTGEDPAVVLSGKMTLSVISPDSENDADEVQESREEEFSVSPLEEQQTQPSSELEKDIQDFLENLKKGQEIQMPTIMLESEDVANTVEVESLEKEVDQLIQEAIESIQQKSEIPILSEQTNEINEPVTSQILNDTLEKPPKPELGQDISNQIEKLIQEVKDLPVIEPKVYIEEQKKEANSLEERLSGVEDQIIVEDIASKQAAEPVEDVEPVEIKKESKTEVIEEMIIKEPIETDQSSKTKAVEQQEDIVLKEAAQPVETKKESKTEIVEEMIIKEAAEAVETDQASKTKALEKEEEDILLKEAAEPVEIEKVIVESNKKPVEQEIKSKTSESNGDELESDEEVEEIEEIVYEEESGEEEEIEIEVEEEEEEEEEVEVEVEESEEEVPNERSSNRTESGSVQRVNGERSEDFVEESKYTTISGATAAENEISDEELIENEEVDEEEEEEIIEIEEEEEEEEVEDVDGNDVNHISSESDVEL